MTQKAATAKRDKNMTIEIDPSQYGGKPKERIVAEISQSPIGANAATARAFSAGTFGAIGITDAMTALREKVGRVKEGNMEEMESLLVAQATSLDAIYNELARRAALNMGEFMNAADTYMRLALKAQSQCRTTVEALAEIKNPRPVAFVKQANIANGPQQVNNGSSTPSHGLRAGEIQNAPNELIRDDTEHGLKLDLRSTQTATSRDSRVASLGEIDRTEVRDGEKKLKS